MFHDFFLPWFAWPQVLTWASFRLFRHRRLVRAGGASRDVAGKSRAALAGGRRASPAISGFSGRMRWVGRRSGCGRSSKPCWPSPVRLHRGGLGGIFRTSARNLLEHPGACSGSASFPTGIYLFHNLAPLVAGKIFWFLWNGSFENGLWGHRPDRPVRGGHLGADTGLVALDRATAARRPREAAIHAEEFDSRRNYRSLSGTGYEVRIA